MFRALLEGDAQTSWDDLYDAVTDELALGDADEFEHMEAFTTTLSRWMVQHLTDEEIGETIRSDLTSCTIKYPQGLTTNKMEKILKEPNRYMTYAPGDAEPLSEMHLISLFEWMLPRSLLTKLKEKDGWVLPSLKGSSTS